MSHFYGGVQGCRGEATRCGSKSSGIASMAKSWNNTVTVYFDCNKGKEEKDIITIGGNIKPGQMIDIKIDPEHLIIRGKPCRLMKDETEVIVMGLEEPIKVRER